MDEKTLLNWTSNCLILTIKITPFAHRTCVVHSKAIPNHEPHPGTCSSSYKLFTAMPITNHSLIRFVTWPATLLQIVDDIAPLEWPIVPSGPENASASPQTSPIQDQQMIEISSILFWFRLYPRKPIAIILALTSILALFYSTIHVKNELFAQNFAHRFQ